MIIFSRMKKEPKIICVVGPTASGKTKLAVELAKEFNGEIISADSRQVFRALDIGTGKDLEEYDNIVYHLIDIKNPGEDFTLFDFLEMARNKIEEILIRGKIPIIAGGTGLYVQGLVQGFTLKAEGRRQKVEGGYSRQELEKKSKAELQEIVIDLDEESFLTIDLDNPYRMIRAIEKAQNGEQICKEKPDFEVLQVGISLPREELHKKIERRVDEWFQEGFYEEVEGLLKSGVSLEWLNRIGLEYKILANYIASKKGSLDSVRFDAERFAGMKDQMKTAIRQYAKRQMTWFKRFPEIVWVNSVSEAKNVAGDYLDKV